MSSGPNEQSACELENGIKFKFKKLRDISDVDQLSILGITNKFVYDPTLSPLMNYDKWVLMVKELDKLLFKRVSLSYKKTNDQNQYGQFKE